MPNRIPDEDYSIFTDCNPENIIPAKKGAWFFRRDHNFYINNTGDVAGEWIQFPYKTVILPRPLPNKPIKYSQRFQLWEKTTDGFKAPWLPGDRTKSILPKTGWKYISSEDAFIAVSDPRPFNWIFPVPINSYDPIGVSGNKSFDNDFYYYKTGSIWYRNPLAIFNYSGSYSGDNPVWYNNLPFVVVPRALPVPSSSYVCDSIKPGDQTYDGDFFYVKGSLWKRAPLLTYTPSKLTLF